jgi:hypothetical protein
LSGIAIVHRSVRLNPGLDRDHTASRKTIETVNDGCKCAFCGCSRASFSVIVRPKSEIGFVKRDNMCGISRPLLHCCNTCGANEDESCRDYGDRLYFVLAKPKMIF